MLREKDKPRYQAIFFKWDSFHAVLCKAEQPLRGMELLKHTGNLFGKNLQLKGVC